MIGVLVRTSTGQLVGPMMMGVQQQWSTAHRQIARHGGFPSSQQYQQATASSQA